MSGKAKTILGAAWAVLVLAVSLSPAPRWLPILLYGFSALLVIVGLLQWYQDRRYAEVQAAQASGFPDISFWFPEASLTGPDADGHHHLTFKGTVTNGEARRVSVSFVLRLKTKSGQISLPIHKPGTYGSLARKPLNIDAHTTDEVQLTFLYEKPDDSELIHGSPFDPVNLEADVVEHVSGQRLRTPMMHGYPVIPLAAT